MSVIRRGLAPRILTIIAVALLFATASGAKKERLVDLFWTTPDSTTLATLGSIALLPPASYDNSIENERRVELAWAQHFGGTGYRWISGTTSRIMLRTGAGGDSVAKAVRGMILKSGRVDSLGAASICARLRVRALVSVRLDNWEQVKMEWNQSGKPSTSIRLSAFLVDSLGRLLWTGSGSEFAEGPYHQPLPSPPGSSELIHGNISSDVGGPPDPAEVLTRLLARWAPHFPTRSTAHAAP